MLGNIFLLCFGTLGLYFTGVEVRDGYNRDIRNRFPYRLWWYYSVVARLIIWTICFTEGLLRLIFGHGIFA